LTDKVEVKSDSYEMLHRLDLEEEEKLEDKRLSYFSEEE
jgi:hypothetical protein